jgi:hypothetical protein
MTNIFEQASRKALRFNSVRGALSVEQLWDLPLTSKSGFDLDTVAKSANSELKALTEESFVVTKTNPAKSLAELKLEVVKHVIAVTIQENALEASAAARKQEKAKLLDVLGQKQDQELLALTPDQIRQKIEALG